MEVPRDAEVAWEEACDAVVCAADDVASLRELFHRQLQFAEDKRAAAHAALVQRAVGVSRHVREFGSLPVHLPQPVEEHIVHHLAGDTRTLCILLCVSKSWAAAVRAPALWRVLRIRENPGGCGLMTDARLARLIARSCGTLMALYLHGCMAVTALGLAPALRLESLEVLQLQRCSAIPLDSFCRVVEKHARIPTGLRDIDIRGSVLRLPDAAVTRLCRFAAKLDLTNFWAELDRQQELLDETLGVDVHWADASVHAVCFSCFCLFESESPGACPWCIKCACCTEEEARSCSLPAASLPERDEDVVTMCVGCRERFEAKTCEHCGTSRYCFRRDTYPVDDVITCHNCGTYVCLECYNGVQWEDACDEDGRVLSDDEDAMGSLDHQINYLNCHSRCGHTRCCHAMLCTHCAADIDEEAMPTCADCGVPLCTACAAAYTSLVPAHRDDGAVADVPTGAFNVLRYCADCMAGCADGDTDRLRTEQPHAALLASAYEEDACAGLLSAAPSAALLKATRRTDVRRLLRDTRDAHAKALRERVAETQALYDEAMTDAQGGVMTRS